MTHRFAPRSFVLAFVLAGLSSSWGCAGKAPPLSAASKCGDQCATLNCPAGSQCTLGGDCTARCEPEYIPPFK